MFKTLVACILAVTTVPWHQVRHEPGATQPPSWTNPIEPKLPTLRFERRTGIAIDDVVARIPDEQRRDNPKVEIVSRPDDVSTVLGLDDRVVAYMANFDAVAVGVVESTEALFTPDRSWIRSRNTLRTIDVWHLSNRGAKSIGRETARIVFESEGGTATIHDLQVVAAIQGTRPIVVGQEYLIYGWVDEKGVIQVSTTAIYETTSRLPRSLAFHLQRDDVESRPLSETKADLLRLLKEPR